MVPARGGERIKTYIEFQIRVSGFSSRLQGYRVQTCGAKGGGFGAGVGEDRHAPDVARDQETGCLPLPHSG